MTDKKRELKIGSTIRYYDTNNQIHTRKVTRIKDNVIWLQSTWDQHKTKDEDVIEVLPLWEAIPYNLRKSPMFYIILAFTMFLLVLYVAGNTHC